MGNAHWYWRFVRLDASGGCVTDEVVQAKEFFRQEFPELVNQADVPDRFIQKRLLQLSPEIGSETNSPSPAECCLRCFISNQIKQNCLHLADQFGKKHGFTYHDLLPYVLDDTSVVRLPGLTRPQPGPRKYESLATRVLKNFDPDRGSLAAWTKQAVRQDRNLGDFLLEHGVYLISDWAILNDTSPEQLQRILSQTYRLPTNEIQRDQALLKSYHAVYRADRRQSRSLGRCQPPTQDQLSRIADNYVSEIAAMPECKAGQHSSLDNLTRQLLDMAERLRRYEIWVRAGLPHEESTDALETLAELEQVDPPDGNLSEPDKQVEFLNLYHQQLIEGLDRAIQAAILARQKNLLRKTPQKAAVLITALCLYYCLGQSMSELAPLIGFKKQYEVTRLLKCDEFEADVRHRTLEFLLQSSILQLARNCAHPDHLQELDNQVEAAIKERLEAVIQKPDKRSNSFESWSAENLFVQRLTHVIQDIQRE